MNMKKLLNIFFIFIFCSGIVFADAFVPEFDTMQTLRCDFEESIYNQDGSLVTKNRQFRVFHLDDAYQKIYLQKEPIDWVSYYGNDKIEFKLQSLTDDEIIMAHTIIDRNAMEYVSTSEITYDNGMFGVRTSKSVGVCKIIN